MGYRQHYEIIGYSYEADLHCIDCTNARFPDLSDDTEDNEGNKVHPIFLGESDGTECCGDCFSLLDD